MSTSLTSLSSTSLSSQTPSVSVSEQSSSNSTVLNTTTVASQSLEAPGSSVKKNLSTVRVSDATNPSKAPSILLGMIFLVTAVLAGISFYNSWTACGVLLTVAAVIALGCAIKLRPAAPGTAENVTPRPNEGSTDDVKRSSSSASSSSSPQQVEIKEEVTQMTPPPIARVPTDTDNTPSSSSVDFDLGNTTQAAPPSTVIRARPPLPTTPPKPRSESPKK